MNSYEHPFFRPLWRRVAVVAACVLWAGLEWWGGSSTWALIAGAMAAYGAWQFFYLYKPPADQQPQAQVNPPADNGPKE